MPGKLISDHQLPGRERARAFPGDADPVNRYPKEHRLLPTAERSSRPPRVTVAGRSSGRAPDNSHAFRFDRESSRRPRALSVLAAELLQVEKTLDHNAEDVLDRRNLPLVR